MKRQCVDHSAYIRAVVEALRAQDIDVDPVDIHDADGIRAANLRLHPQDEDHAFTMAEHVDLHWDERLGWALIPHYPPTSRLGDVPWRHGPDILPDPKSIAAWSYLLINRPDLTPSYQASDLQSDQKPALDLEKRLAAFAEGN